MLPSRTDSVKFISGIELATTRRYTNPRLHLPLLILFARHTWCDLIGARAFRLKVFRFLLSIHLLTSCVLRVQDIKEISAKPHFKDYTTRLVCYV